MNLLRSTNKTTQKTSYFVDGRRVSKFQYEEVRFWRKLNCFRTEETPTQIKQYSEC